MAVQKKGTPISRAALLDSGVKPWELRQKVAGGTLTRVRRGLYVVAGEPVDHVWAAEMGARLTCVSAAKAYGLWALAPSTLHLWKSNGEFSPNHSRKLHRPLPEGAFVSLLDCVMHALRCLPPREALAYAESAVKSGRLTFEALIDRLSGNRNAKLRQLVEMIDTHSDSMPETFVRFALCRAGIDFEIQARVSGVGIVDFLIEGRLIVEVDGYAYHSDRKAFRRDLQRNNAATIAGYKVLRFSFEDVVHNIGEVIRQIREALADDR